MLLLMMTIVDVTVYNMTKVIMVESRVQLVLNIQLLRLM